MQTPSHIFVSYSHKDAEFVDKFVTDLKQKDFDVWIDHRIRPGTPNYEKAIREAITNAYTLLLIVTPNSRDSNYVQNEVAFAQNRNCPIYPIWVEGDNWQDSVGIEMVKTQYIDLRGASYPSGIKRVFDVLNDEIKRSQPPHFVLPSSLSSHTSETAGRLYPKGYFRLVLDQQKHIAVRCSAFNMIGQMSDEIYRSYLQDRYLPYTYGSKWLYGKLFHNEIVRVAASLSYLTMMGDEPLSKNDPTWRELSLTDYGMVPDSDWTIIDNPAKSLTIFALLVNNVGIVDELNGAYPTKMRYGLAKAIVDSLSNREPTLTLFGTMFRLTPPHKVERNQYKHLFMLALDKKSGHSLLPSALQTLNGRLIAEVQ